LFILLSFFCWPLCCLSFFDLRIMITSLLSSSSSYVKCFTKRNGHLQSKFEDTKWVIISRKSKKVIQYNDQNKKDKRTNTTQKTKHWTQIKRDEVRCSGRVKRSCSTGGTRRVLLLQNALYGRRFYFICRRSFDNINAVYKRIEILHNRIIKYMKKTIVFDLDQSDYYPNVCYYW